MTSLWSHAPLLGLLFVCVAVAALRLFPTSKYSRLVLRWVGPYPEQAEPFANFHLRRGRFSFVLSIFLAAALATLIVGQSSILPIAGESIFTAALFSVFMLAAVTLLASLLSIVLGGVLIARDRDVPISSTFGPNTLTSFKVWSDEVGIG